MEDKNPENVNTPYRKDIEETKKEEQKYNEIVEDLLANPKVQEFQRDYLPSSVESFIKNYATEKVRILGWGPKFELWHEDEETKWFEECFSCFEEIQQKKLFDLQCQWRADQIKVKGIDKELVGKVCADIKFLKPVEPYKGKGITSSDQFVLRKEGKKK